MHTGQDLLALHYWNAEELVVWSDDRNRRSNSSQDIGKVHGFANASMFCCAVAGEEPVTSEDDDEDDVTVFLAAVHSDRYKDIRVDFLGILAVLVALVSLETTVSTVDFSWKPSSSSSSSPPQIATFDPYLGI
mmetsp:Transcript_3876/g.9329  ORF Transcript_3876/g.9329 Transcript_3876/m.9329 type:complete len:133 (+) Transcript_3876:1918-2316(+)